MIFTSNTVIMCLKRQINVKTNHFVSGRSWARLHNSNSSEVKSSSLFVFLFASPSRPSVQTIIQADYNKLQCFFFFFTLVNHLPQNWLITSASWNYWWCNALHAFHIRGSETEEKREKKQKHSQNTYPWKPWKFLIFFFHIIIQYRSLSGDVIAAVTVTSSHSKKVQS